MWRTNSHNTASKRNLFQRKLTYTYVFLLLEVHKNNELKEIHRNYACILMRNKEVNKHLINFNLSQVCI